MNDNNTGYLENELDTCPGCGQVIYCNGREPLDVCTCETALAHQERGRVKVRLYDNLAELCGEGCGDASPCFTPLAADTYALLESLCGAVGEVIAEQIVVTLPDGTKIKISDKGIERTITYKRKAV